eukprot:Opistho-2@93008
MPRTLSTLRVSRLKTARYRWLHRHPAIAEVSLVPMTCLLSAASEAALLPASEMAPYTLDRPTIRLLALGVWRRYPSPPRRGPAHQPSWTHSTAATTTRTRTLRPRAACTTTECMERPLRLGNLTGTRTMEMNLSLDRRAQRHQPWPSLAGWRFAWPKGFPQIMRPYSLLKGSNQAHFLDRRCVSATSTATSWMTSLSVHQTTSPRALRGVLLHRFPVMSAAFTCTSLGRQGVLIAACARSSLALFPAAVLGLPSAMPVNLALAGVTSVTTLSSAHRWLIRVGVCITTLARQLSPPLPLRSRK